MRSRAGDVIKTIQVKDLISSSTERYEYYTDITVFCNLRAGYEVESSKTLNFSNTTLTLVSAIIYLFQFPPSDDQGFFFVCLVFVFFFFILFINSYIFRSNSQYSLTQFFGVSISIILKRGESHWTCQSFLTRPPRAGNSGKVGTYGQQRL